MRLKYFFFGVVLVVAACNLSRAAPSREAFLEYPDVIDMSISPSGQYLAQILHRDGKRIIAIQDLTVPDNPVVGIKSDERIHHYSVSWANNERVLVKALVPQDLEIVKKIVIGDDFDLRHYPMVTRVIAMNPDTSETVVLMSGDEQAKRNKRLDSITHHLPGDSDHVLMRYYRRGVMVLAKVNVHTGETQLVAEGSKYTFLFVADSQTGIVYRLDYWPIAERVDILELPTGADSDEWVEVDEVDFSGHEEYEYSEGMELAGIRGDEFLYRKRNESTGYYELVTHGGETEVAKTVASLEDRDIMGVVMSPSSGDAIGFWYLDKVRRYRFFDEADQEHYDELARDFEGQNFFVKSMTRSGALRIIYAYGPRNSGAYYLYNQKRRKLSPISEANFDLSQEELGIPRDTYIEARDRTSIHTYMLFPPDYEKQRRYPLVVLPHGGPHSQEWADFDHFAQFVATRGYIVIKPNFRGSTGYGLEFEEAGYKQWGGVMQDDVTDTVLHMIAEGYADPDRVCIVGASYGGYVALTGMTKTPSMYKCAVSINGVAHLPDMIEYDESLLEGDELVERMLYSRVGHPDEDQAMLERNSPALQADKVKGDVLLIAGKRDRVVQAKQSRMMADRLDENGKQYDYIELEDAGHHVMKDWESREKVYQEVERFLGEHLADSPAPAQEIEK